MKRLLTSLAAALILALTLAGSAFATHATDHTLGPPQPTGHPFCDSGEEYAHGHIRDLAQAQLLGPAHFHTPGWHQGFAVCNPAGIF